MPDTVDRHWLWAAFSEDSALLYGCLIHKADPWAAIAESDKLSSTSLGEQRIQIVQNLVNTAKSQQIIDALGGQSVIDLTDMGGPTFKFGSSRRRLLDGFGRTAQSSTTYASLRIPELSDAEWRTAFDFLKSTIGIDFRRASDRIGAFDIFDSPKIESSEMLIDLDIDRENNLEATNYPDSVIIRHRRIGSSAVNVQLQLKLSGDWVFSRLFVLSPGQELRFKAVPFDHYCMSVFDEAGSLAQFEEHSLFLRAGLNMSMLASVREVDDRLARSAQGLSSPLRDRASVVQTRSTRRSLIGVNNVPFDVYQAQMRALIKRLVPPIGSDRWFPRGVAHEVNVISYLNTLLDGARVNAGVLVDPFFGVDTLKRVIARLESVDVALTVVTSLRGIDPETNQQNEDLISKLRQALDELRSDRVPNASHRLQVINLVDGSDQAFHDRYLLLNPHEGEKEVYLLSNSLNRSAGVWPFCISKLDPAAAHDAALYIDGLTHGRDISSSTQPTITFQWPSNDKR
ncbi:VPA1262 family N-terminal domain-containing protein [Methylobacterium sp. ID0610]|uniref:VPA1262 family N-terminal domain-containing protein n=1 Tax=Methylobacterium carpenticola TaxID=3344827 RepID=UPI0036B85439